MGTIELTTDRLVLRRHRPEDAPVLHENFGKDEKMFEYSGWNPYATPEAAEKSVRMYIDSYADEHFYGWAIEADGRLIGTMGAYDYDPEAGTIELGCSIERKSWGKGYGTEAAKAVLPYLTDCEGLKCVKAWCAGDNIGSARIMEKAGMVHINTESGALKIGDKSYDKMNFEYRKE